MTPALIRRTEGLLSAHELKQRMQASLRHLSAPFPSDQHMQNIALQPEAGAHNGLGLNSSSSSSTQGPCAAASPTTSQPNLIGLEELVSSMPPVPDILAALTSKSAGEAFDCEAAEVVGDAVLDYLAVMHLFHMLP